ncbi:hypothetical protein JAAARDRAFT_133685 [Jaapia argillacea MUCL 33604]|uniref:Transcription factor domain-containing protein n=1 Tax=Jaapia argillacea MUCL 33604 TaxID=933084 RepID=A0A067PL28_9AGAM|nr:hypothetical protein JAAARDRAFT_133685 [Jaapia argillacea MUCL 33604]
MQPSFIYAGLAMGILIKSSEVEGRAAGRSRALYYRDAAQASLEASWNSQWIDPTLAEAALILALFESSSHPEHTSQRASTAIGFLDSIIRALSLTFIDASDPTVSTFSRRSVPIVPRSSHSPHSSSSRYSSISPHSSPKESCSCRHFSHLTPSSPVTSGSPFPTDSQQMSYSWSATLGWDPSWSDAEVRKEEGRRVCWSALSLVSGYTAYCVMFQEKPLDLFLIDASNWKLLFPGEILARPSTSRSPNPSQRGSPSPKETIWALHCRSMLLWNSCLLLRDDTISHEERADLAWESWVEAGCIQDALDEHTCNVDTGLMYMCREFIYKYVSLTRLSVTQTLRRLVPSSEISSSMFNRKHAEEWLYYQDQLAKHVKSSIHHLGHPQGQFLTRRPWSGEWFAGQLATCLLLWSRDRSLLLALELAKSFLVPLDVLNCLWPCAESQARGQQLRERLDAACQSAGMQSPLPRDYTLPPILAR